MLDLLIFLSIDTSERERDLGQQKEETGECRQTHRKNFLFQSKCSSAWTNTDDLGENVLDEWRQTTKISKNNRSWTDVALEMRRFNDVWMFFFSSRTIVANDWELFNWIWYEIRENDLSSMRSDAIKRKTSSRKSLNTGDDSFHSPANFLFNCQQRTERKSCVSRGFSFD